MTGPSWDGARLFARIAQDISDQPDVAATTHRIAELAKTVAGCDAAGVWRSSRVGTVQLVAASDEGIVPVIHDIVLATHEGPAYQCLHDERTVRLADLSSDARWPDYAARVKASGLGVRSAVAYPLQAEGETHGALVLYSIEPGYFSNEVVEIGSVLASHAALALDLADTSAHAENLAKALETSRQIGTAIGIVMTEYKITNDAAFDLLRVASQQLHRKLHDIADEVILTGAIPDWRSEAS